MESMDLDHLEDLQTMPGLFNQPKQPIEKWYPSANMGRE